MTLAVKTVIDNTGTGGGCRSRDDNIGIRNVNNNIHSNSLLRKLLPGGVCMQLQQHTLGL